MSNLYGFPPSNPHLIAGSLENSVAASVTVGDGEEPGTAKKKQSLSGSNVVPGV
jgi:hypothetical protein